MLGLKSIHVIILIKFIILIKGPRGMVINGNGFHVFAPGQYRKTIEDANIFMLNLNNSRNKGFTGCGYRTMPEAENDLLLDYCRVLTRWL